MKEVMTMKQFKKMLMAGLLTMAMAVSVFGTVTPVSAASLTAKQYLKKMDQATQKAKSYEASQTVTMKQTAQGQAVTTKTSTKQITFQNPLKSKIVTTVKVSGDGVDQSSKSVAYLKEDSKGKVTEYVSTDGSDFQEVDLSDISDAGVGSNTDLFSGAKIVKKSVKVNKTDTVQISANVQGSALMDTLEQLGISGDMITQLGVDTKTLKPIKVTIWINKKNYQPVKMTMDMKNFCNSIYSSMSEAMGAEIGKCSAAKSVAIYSKFNKATKFSFPKF